MTTTLDSEAASDVLYRVQIPASKVARSASDPRDKAEANEVVRLFCISCSFSHGGVANDALHPRATPLHVSCDAACLDEKKTLQHKAQRSNSDVALRSATRSIPTHLAFPFALTMFTSEELLSATMILIPPRSFWP